MAEYTFPGIHFSWPEQLLNGQFLWIWNADSIPPHIGISQKAGYFSLTYKELEISKSVESMLEKVKRSAIPLVLVDLNDWEFEKDPALVFREYTNASAGGPTCLSPIKEVLGVGNEILQLAHLLTEIEKRGKMKSVFAVHLTNAYRGIPDYSVTEIMQRIEQLHDTKRP